jgi:class 3 adenylate cyclase
VSIRAAAGELGLKVRIGVHTGEVEIEGADVRGVAVHEAARLAAAAPEGEILVSSTTQQLASGAGIQFESLGEREFKGLPGARSVYAVVGSGGGA